MSWRLNETTVVEDALAAIKLLRDHLGEKPKVRGLRFKGLFRKFYKIGFKNMKLLFS